MYVWMDVCVRMQYACMYDVCTNLDGFGPTCGAFQMNARTDAAISLQESPARPQNPTTPRLHAPAAPFPFVCMYVFKVAARHNDARLLWRPCAHACLGGAAAVGHGMAILCAATPATASQIDIKNQFLAGRASCTVAQQQPPK